jgi:hypothetical protein
VVLRVKRCFLETKDVRALGRGTRDLGAQEVVNLGGMVRPCMLRVATPSGNGGRPCRCLLRPVGLLPASVGCMKWQLGQCGVQRREQGMRSPGDVPRAMVGAGLPDSAGEGLTVSAEDSVGAGPGCASGLGRNGAPSEPRPN